MINIKYKSLIFVVTILLIGGFNDVFAEIKMDSLIKASGPAVYYYANDSKRYVFPDQKTYNTWFSDFSGIIEITDEELGQIPIGGNVTYRPGVKLVKITTNPKVYAVSKNGNLRWIKTETIAKKLYGDDWAKEVNDLPDSFFINYSIGLPIEDEDNPTSEFNPDFEKQEATSISIDKSIGDITEIEKPKVPKETAVPSEMSVLESSVVFEDSFEEDQWNGLWTTSRAFDWYRLQSRSYDGIYSAEFGGPAHGETLTSISIDLQGRDTATVSFAWQIRKNFEADEFLAFEISTDGGKTWQEKARLAGSEGDPDEIWILENIEITNISSLQIRFKADTSSSNERANVDMVTVVAG